jgi:hypothetical protein
MNIKSINNYNILRTQVLLMFVFTSSLIISIINENTDSNTSIFAFILYLPYVFILCIYNGILIKLLVNFLKNNLLIYLFPIIPIIVWFIMSDYTITIRFWKLNRTEVIIGLILMMSVNLFGCYFYPPENEKQIKK